MNNKSQNPPKSLLTKIITTLFSDQNGSFPLFLHSLRLEDQVFDFTLVRFFVSLLIIVGAYFAKYVLSIDDLNHQALTILALVLFGLNLINFSVVYPIRKKKEKKPPHQILLNVILHVSIATDFIFLTIALWYVGGIYSPFQAFFIFHVIIASVLLSPRTAYIFTLYGYLLFLGLAITTWQNWIPAHFPTGAVPVNRPPTGTYVFTVIVVQGLLFFLTALLTTHLMFFLREGQRQIVRINKDLENLSNQRKNFLQVTLHNLRAPISAIQMHLQNLMLGYGGELNETQRFWVERSIKRVEELIEFLYDLENLSAVENPDILKRSEKFDLCELIRKVVEENKDLIEKKKHIVILDLPSGTVNFTGIQRLLKEAILNYLTNAVKYTPESGKIVIRLKQSSNKIIVEVEDNGIGIDKEDFPKLFKEFGRLKSHSVETSETKGSGLGLYIVKQIVELHKGKVFVRSEKGKGSTFGFELPC